MPECALLELEEAVSWWVVGKWSRAMPSESSIKQSTMHTIVVITTFTQKKDLT